MWALARAAKPQAKSEVLVKTILARWSECEVLIVPDEKALFDAKVPDLRVVENVVVVPKLAWLLTSWGIKEERLLRRE